MDTIHQEPYTHHPASNEGKVYFQKVILIEGTTVVTFVIYLQQAANAFNDTNNVDGNETLHNCFMGKVGIFESMVSI